MINEKRKTRESEIDVSLEKGNMRKFKIDTGLNFFNHMIETIAWRACMNIDAKYRNVQFKLGHVIIEDVAIVLGKTFRKMLEKEMEKGINCSGFSICTIDEALAIAAISLEGRSNCFINRENVKGANTEMVEGIATEDLAEFFSGFSQGAGATVNVKILSGTNPHHTWEAVFRAFGECLKMCFEENEFRKGTTAGVKGTLE